MEHSLLLDLMAEVFASVPADDQFFVTYKSLMTIHLQRGTIAHSALGNLQDSFEDSVGVALILHDLLLSAFPAQPQ